MIDIHLLFLIFTSSSSYDVASCFYDTSKPSHSMSPHLSLLSLSILSVRSNAPTSLYSTLSHAHRHSHYLLVFNIEMDHVFIARSCLGRAELLHSVSGAVSVTAFKFISYSGLITLSLTSDLNFAANESGRVRLLRIIIIQEGAALVVYHSHPSIS